MFTSILHIQPNLINLIPDMTTAFPLRDITRHELKQLCRALWGWNVCPDCENVSSTSYGQRQSLQCRAPNCCFSSQYQQQYERLDPFFDFYKQITGPYVPDFFDPDDQALRSHQDLFDIISLLRDHGEHLTRDECRLMYFSQRGHGDSKSKNDGTCTVPIADQERAFNLATTIMTMVKMGDFSTPNFDLVTSDPEQGVTTPLQDMTTPLIWRPEQTLQEALLDTFPHRIHPNLQPGDPQAKTILSELTAVNLTRIAKLRLVGTNDLRNHLRLDTVSGTVHIFPHTSFLKAHLLASKRDIEFRRQQHAASIANVILAPGSSQSQPGPDSDLNCESLDEGTPRKEKEEQLSEKTSDCFTFPRQLAFETLSTLSILFPPPSHPQFHQSQSLLRSLVSKSHFDPDIFRFGTTAYQLPSEQPTFSTTTPPFPNTPDEIPTTIANPAGRPPRRIQRPGDGDEGMYPIFGHRLMTLYTELEDPTPRGILDVWLEKRSKSRHVMLVTLAGVTVAIILGVLSLSVSVFQTWISWQEWKHPT